MFELQEFIERVRRAASSHGPEQAVAELLGELLEMPRPMWAQQGDGPAEQLLHHAQQVTIYLIRGEPMRRFPPHEHGMVAAVAMLEGTETHRFFAADPGGRLRLTEIRHLTGPCVELFDERAIHAVEYRSSAPVLAVHVYLGDLVLARRRMWNHDGTDPTRYDQARYDRLAMDVSAETGSG
ncbi:MAG: hypothetical protein OXI74_08905 [Rhodospirillaceae bacterium]|nr:hypothetical protein [Rhodospirillaceae bacterium]